MSEEVAAEAKRILARVLGVTRPVDWDGDHVNALEAEQFLWEDRTPRGEGATIRSFITLEAVRAIDWCIRYALDPAGTERVRGPDRDRMIAADELLNCLLMDASVEDTARMCGEPVADLLYDAPQDMGIRAFVGTPEAETSAHARSAIYPAIDYGDATDPQGAAKAANAALSALYRRKERA